MTISEVIKEVKEDQEIEYQIEVGRAQIAKNIIKNASPQLADLGIEILDLRFKRINYVKEVQQKIFERMISERRRIADKYRSEGQGEASEIIGDKERDLKKIQSEAYKKAEEIKGEADAKATKIYADAYNQSSSSRDFYEFTKTLETYRKTLSSKDWLIMSTEGDVYKYLRKESGR